MALDPNDKIIYVMDTKNDRIQKFDMNENFLSKCGISEKLREADRNCNRRVKSKSLVNNYNREGIATRE